MHLTEQELAMRVTRYEVMKRALIVFTAFVVTVCLVVLSFVASQNRKTLATVKDCTQPTGQCYRDGQKRTGEAVSNINRVVILAAACASGLPQGLPVETRQTEIQQCVIQRLAATTHQPKR